MFRFFVNMLPEGVEATYSIGMLYSFAINLLMAFGAVFEAPVIVVLLVFFGIVDIATLKKSRRYVVIAAFIIGALLTPADPLSQVMMAIPVIILYEVGLIFAQLLVNKKAETSIEESEA